MKNRIIFLIVMIFTDNTIKTMASGGSSTKKSERVEWHELLNVDNMAIGECKAER